MSERFIIHKDEPMHSRVKANALRYIEGLSIRYAWAVEVKRHVRKRSTDANARWWALMTAISNQAPPHMDGQWYDPEIWHEHLVRRFAGVEPGPFDEAVRKRTSQMDSEQFQQLMEEVEAWAYNELPGFRFDRSAA